MTTLENPVNSQDCQMFFMPFPWINTLGLIPNKNPWKNINEYSCRFVKPIK